MPRNLHDRATDQLNLHLAAEQRVRDALTAARQQRDLRHENPDSVVAADWGDLLGATQHLEVALQALAELRGEEAAIRERLADIDNPADATTHETELRAVMVADAAMRVSVRDATERAARAQTLAEGLASLLTRIEVGIRAAEARLAWATEHQQAGDALRDALPLAPLDTLVADATALQADAAFTEAETRLGELLPAELRDRAAERAEEAAALLDRLTGHDGTVREAQDARLSVGSPLDGAAASALRSFLAAESSLARYVRTAPTDLQQAREDLVPLADLADLTTAQSQALDAANNADGVAAVAAEQALVAALTPFLDAREALEDAILAALTADPDADPEADATVVAARATFDNAAVQDPVSAARAGYGSAERADLDAWEVEVPADLWDFLGSFIRADRALQRLSDQAARDALATGYDDAQDALADALDEVDTEARRHWAIDEVAGQRAAAAEAALGAVADRTSQYTRGDGPSGRTPAEL